MLEVLRGLVLWKERGSERGGRSRRWEGGEKREGGEEGNGGGGRGWEGLGKREGKEEEDMVVCECVSVCGVWRYVGATCGG